jgi:hypothetical protein
MFKGQSHEHYCNSLKAAFDIMGKPKRVHTDNGGPFVAKGLFL